jgi:hypothetical protein
VSRVFAFLFLLSAAALFSRELVIQVEDADFEVPLAGARAQWPSGGAQCGEDGRAALSLPDGAEITVVITYPAYKTARFPIPRQGNFFIIRLSSESGTVRENEEFLFEASRLDDGRGESAPGITLPEREFIIASEIGIVEDVMNSIKLLPGVGYAGMFNAMPSIRGGDPGDLQAVLDGFYIDNPYHWGGGFSIFDPKMVQRATLSHGVFSARFGHTVSGILDVSSKRASNKYAELEIGLSTSAFNFSAALPLGEADALGARKGGAAFFGKLTYWDGFVWTAQGLAHFAPALSAVNAVSTAPYIRSFGFSANYRFTPSFEALANGYVGSDGVGVTYENEDATAQLLGDPHSSLKYSWSNVVSFLSAGLLYNPLNTALVKATFGAGYNAAEYIYKLRRSFYSYNDYGDKWLVESKTNDLVYMPVVQAQARVEADWLWNEAFLFSAGIEEAYRGWGAVYENNLVRDMPMPNGTYKQIDLYPPDVQNKGFFSSGWGIVEWKPPQKKYRVEAGLRVDHLLFSARDFTTSELPALNPRINASYRLLSDTAHIDSLTLSAGTGLFSSISPALTIIDGNMGVDDWRETRAWTSVLGVKTEFAAGWTLNVEAYYKHIYNRAYSDIVQIGQYVGEKYFFDGFGHAAGVDIMLQKFRGERYNGWLSYSFNITRYNNPQSAYAFGGVLFQDGENKWYYPVFHRSHILNLVMNFRFRKKFNLYTRAGFASGIPDFDRKISSYILITSGGNYIHKWRESKYYTDAKRTPFTVPLDLKLSYSFYKPDGKASGEFYIAVENTLVLLLPKRENQSLNPYTGKYEPGSDNPLYELPIPMVSFGFKWSY